jgi:hypothetical protein
MFGCIWIDAAFPGCTYLSLLVLARQSLIQVYGTRIVSDACSAHAVHAQSSADMTCDARPTGIAQRVGHCVLPAGCLWLCKWICVNVCPWLGMTERDCYASVKSVGLNKMAVFNPWLWLVSSWFHAQPKLFVSIECLFVYVWLEVVFICIFMCFSHLTYYLIVGYHGAVIVCVPELTADELCSLVSCNLRYIEHSAVVLKRCVCSVQ